MGEQQLPLPGVDPPATPRRRRGQPRRAHTRVWSDPAVLEAEEVAQARFEDWSHSFATFVARLTPERRAELRRVLGEHRPRSDPA